MKSRTIVIFVLTITIVTVACWPFLRMLGRSERFLSDATEILADGEPHPDIVEIDLTGNGSFRALIEHSCCSGAGFDAVALQTSDGKVYHSRNNYCSEEGFYAEMTRTDLESLADLDKFLLANGYTKIGQTERE
ncbi:hypothetical protein VSU19_12575 [Verrucomicrobiales bacterium BCK34]|nr:hypothetical protein [Verrucomicrobiales bacterium BCK34]